MVSTNTKGGDKIEPKIEIGPQSVPAWSLILGGITLFINVYVGIGFISLSVFLHLNWLKRKR